jgi:hypothetical protein
MAPNRKNNPQVVVLAGPGPFRLPATGGLPFFLAHQGEVSPILLGLTLADDRQLIIPTDEDFLRHLWKMLDPFFRPNAPGKMS